MIVKNLIYFIFIIDWMIVVIFIVNRVVCMSFERFIVFLFIYRFLWMMIGSVMSIIDVKDC